MGDEVPSSYGPIWPRGEYAKWRDSGLGLFRSTWTRFDATGTDGQATSVDRCGWNGTPGEQGAIFGGAQER